MKYVSVFMDVEDPINPLADDAALDFAHLFTEVGVRGSFCITGEKCRTLLARGRFDVIEAFKPHCLGLHTDTHSQHPTTMELLADLSYVEGCEAALETEQRGREAFIQAFGRNPSFWGGAGNTWSPEISDALKRLDIPAYVYALTDTGGIHKFNGVTAFPQDVSIGEGDWIDSERSRMRSTESLSQIDQLIKPWIGVFVGHPTRFRYKQFWDFPYAGGLTPSDAQFAEPVRDEEYERGKQNLRSFLLRLKQQIPILGIDDVLKMPWQFRPLSNDEKHYFQKWTAHHLRQAAHWPIHRPGLDTGRIVAKTLALIDSVEKADSTYTENRQA